jgi:hypothetical protein
MKFFGWFKSGGGNNNAQQNSAAVAEPVSTTSSSTLGGESAGPPPRVALPLPLPLPALQRFNPDGRLGMVDAAIAEESQRPAERPSGKKPLSFEESHPLTAGLEFEAEKIARTVGAGINREAFKRESADGLTRYGDGAVNPQRGNPIPKPGPVDLDFILRICPLSRCAEGVDVEQLRAKAEESDELYSRINDHAINANNLRRLVESGVAAGFEGAREHLASRLSIAKRKWKESLKSNNENLIAISRNVTAALHGALLERLTVEMKEARELGISWTPSQYVVTIDASIQILNNNTDALRRGYNQPARDFCWGIPKALIEDQTRINH